MKKKLQFKKKIIKKIKKVKKKYKKKVKKKYKKSKMINIRSMLLHILQQYHCILF